MGPRNGSHILNTVNSTSVGKNRNGLLSRNGRTGGTYRPRPGDPKWASFDDERLLDMRLCDLGLKLEGTVVQPRIQRLYDELSRREILLRPHVWLSSEWFSPDGIPGIAVPFYLAHERLAKLEQKLFLQVEGGGERECMKLLRHEAGHAICNAYRLHYKKRWRELFGRFTEPYPDYYEPKPDSKNYVIHLDRWYAQAHPAEDFAETFAVWLRSRTGSWRQQYRHWPALRKLEYVDQIMREVRGVKPPVRCRQLVEPLSQLRMTLREHYKHKRETYTDDWPDFYDRDLRSLFADHEVGVSGESAASFLRRIRPKVRQAVSRWTGEYPYTVDQVLRDMIDRCKELDLRLTTPHGQAETDTTLMVAVQTMNYLHGGRHRIAL